MLLSSWQHPPKVVVGILKMNRRCMQRRWEFWKECSKCQVYHQYYQYVRSGAYEGRCISMQWISLMIYDSWGWAENVMMCPFKTEGMSWVRSKTGSWAAAAPCRGGKHLFTTLLMSCSAKLNTARTRVHLQGVKRQQMCQLKKLQGQESSGRQCCLFASP